MLLFPGSSWCLSDMIWMQHMPKWSFSVTAENKLVLVQLVLSIGVDKGKCRTLNAAWSLEGLLWDKSNKITAMRSAHSDIRLLTLPPFFSPASEWRLHQISDHWKIQHKETENRQESVSVVKVWRQSFFGTCSIQPLIPFIILKVNLLPWRFKVKEVFDWHILRQAGREETWCQSGFRRVQVSVPTMKLAAVTYSNYTKKILVTMTR